MQILGVFFSLILATSFATAAPDTKIKVGKTLGNPNAPRTGTFYYNLEVEPETLNPVTSTDLYAQVIHSHVFDSLLERNSDTYQWQPALANKFEVSKDGTEFTFHIREGATFHDGKPVTVQDVKFSFDVIFDETYNAAHLRPYYEGIKEAVIVDSNTIKFVAREKYFGNFNVVAGITVFPKHFYGDAKAGVKKNKTLLGSGPYKIDKYDQGQNIQLIRNDNWYGAKLESNQGRYNFDRIFMRFIKDDKIAMERLKKGEIDYQDMTAEMFEKDAVGPDWGKSVKKFKIQNLAPKSYGYIGWNLTKPMFADRDVRIALAHLMNRAEMNKKFRYGYSKLATGPWYQQSEYADPNVKPFAFDPKKANELLKKAGWADTDKNGVLDKILGGQKAEFSFDLLYPNKNNEKYLTLYQEDLKKAGIQMNLKFIEWNALLKAMDERKFDAINLGWGAGSVDLDPRQIWHSKSAGPGGSNRVAYVNPEVDKLIDQGRAELDKKKRIQLFRKVYAMIAADAPYAFMFNDDYLFYGKTSRIGAVKQTYGYDIGRDFFWIQQ